MFDLDSDTLKDPNQLYGILFWAPWAEPSIFTEQLLDDQAEEYPTIQFGKVNADEHKELVSLFAVNSIPALVFLRNGKMVLKYAGADPVEILQTLQKASKESTQEPLEERLKALVNRHRFMIFIKGTPSAPRCGFTGTLLKTLKELNIDFDYFDILSDDEIRQGLKVYSQWPTYPQIYVNGELLGGLDIFLDMKQSGQLQDVLDSLN